MRFADWNKIEMCVYYDVCNKCVWIWMVDAIVDDIDVDDEEDDDDDDGWCEWAKKNTKKVENKNKNKKSEDE